MTAEVRTLGGRMLKDEAEPNAAKSACRLPDDQAPLSAETLGRDEIAMLRACEFELESGLSTFIRVGSALAAIRDSRLYRNTHSSFESYCADRWNLKRQRAYELIDAAAIAGNLSEISDIGAVRESHLAPLASLTPAEQREAWIESVETAPRRPGDQPIVTAGHVKRTVQRRQHAMNGEIDGGQASPATSLGGHGTPAADSSSKSPPLTVLSCAQSVATALMAGEPGAVRYAANRALTVLDRRRMGTPPETLAKCVELLLRAISEVAP